MPDVSEALRHQMVVEWNDPLEYPIAGLLPELVARRAAERPRAVALTAENESVTYGELEARAVRLAARLRGRVGPETVVGILLDRSPDQVAALLAVWKCGGAVLPLDPEHPPERRDYILRDALGAAGLVLTREELAGEGIEAGGPVAPLLPEQTAYVLYTSGSTGHPKGIAVSHGALANRILWACAAEVGEGDAFLYKTTLTFDVALAEIFAPLVAGGRCVLARPGGQRDLAYLADLIAREAITHASFPPAALRLLLELPGAADKLRSLRVLVTGGETVPPDLPARTHAVLPAATLYNRYGPTETTISVLTGACDPRRRDEVLPLGRPIARARVYVLDPEMRPLPPGGAGEIHVGGVCVARGYLGRPDLTAERFIPDPVGDEPGERLYRTGDRGRWRPDGAMEFLGRTDSQVKIRGYRVEVEEVEAALGACPGVREAVVGTVEEPATGSRRLVAWVVPQEGADLDADGLRRALAGRLAEYMVPSAFVLCTELPRTLSGKVDRAALMEQAGRAASGEASGAPETALERTLAGIVQELLQAPRVGVDDDLLGLGFHSLLLARLQARVREAAGAEVPLADLVRAGTVRGLARLLAGEEGPGIGPAELAAEATLAPDVRPRGAYAFSADPRTVLLTGATGFLGGHLLAELLARTAARVLCLVRDPAALSESARIVPVAGDLARPGLGLPEAEFQALAETVEAIYHCGAQVNHLYPYEALRDANVEGTREILRLAVTGRAKALHHVSTLAVLEGRTEPRAEKPLDGDPRGISDGYTQSKWVAERLVQTAIERGVPAAIYRPGWIAGGSRGGGLNPDDFLTRLALGSLRAGVAPEVGTVEICPTPVDWTAEAIVHLSLRRESAAGVFHLINPHPVPLREVLAAAREMGAPLREVSLDRWAAALAELAGGGFAPLAPFAGMLHRLANEPEDRRLQPPRFASPRTQAVAPACPRIDRRLLAAWLGALLQDPGHRDVLLEAGALGALRGVER